MLVKKSQNDSEIARFADWIYCTFTYPDHSQPCVYMEIGSYAGESLGEVAEVLPEGSYIICVDLVTNPTAHERLKLVIKEIEQKYSHKVTLILGDSNDPGVVLKVEQVLENIKENDSRITYADLVFIDGNHSFRYAYNDYLNWRSMFRFVAFHDIAQESIKRNAAKHGGIEVASSAHIWLMLTEMIPQFSLGYAKEADVNNPIFGDEQLWWEFIAPDSYQGIGVVKS